LHYDCLAALSCDAANYFIRTLLTDCAVDNHFGTLCRQVFPYEGAYFFGRANYYRYFTG